MGPQGQPRGPPRGNHVGPPGKSHGPSGEITWAPIFTSKFNQLKRNLNVVITVTNGIAVFGGTKTMNSVNTHSSSANFRLGCYTGSSWMFEREWRILVGFPGGTSGKEPTCQYRRNKK